MTEPTDEARREIDALRKMVTLLTPFDGPTQQRIVRWLAERYLPTEETP